MPANSIFLDTSGWFALLNRDDRLHPVASEIWLEIGERRNPWIFLTDWIVAETGNGLARTAARSRFADSVRRLLDAQFRISDFGFLSSFGIL